MVRSGDRLEYGAARGPYVRIIFVDSHTCPNLWKRSNAGTERVDRGLGGLCKSDFGDESFMFSYILVVN